jgi:hypothetical protein
MTDDGLKELASKIESLKESVDILIKLAALNIGKDIYFKNRGTKEERIEALATLQLPDKIVALIVGSSPETVQVLRRKIKNKRRNEPTKEIEFHPEDLLNVLSNSTMFPSTKELRDFAEEILKPSLPLYLNDSRVEIINQIIQAFQSSDRMRQALFIQALEHRATARELKDTRFLRFLEGWESHIKG